MVHLTRDVVWDRASRLITDAADRAFAALPGAPPALTPGLPQLVRVPTGDPSYWLVAGLGREGVQAIARILGDGRIATVGLVQRSAEDAAAAVTGLSAAQARLQRPPGAVAGPTLVNDGPIAREAWLHVVTDAHGDKQWVFTTGAGTYERPAGTPPMGGPVG